MPGAVGVIVLLTIVLLLLTALVGVLLRWFE